MRNKNFILIFFLIFLLNGCSTAIKLSPENARKIKTIYVQPEIKTVKEANYYGRSQDVGRGFGLIGAAITLSATQDDREFVRKWGRTANITNIVYKQWRNQLLQAGYSDSNKSSDATLITDITLYGIVGHAFAAKYAPNMMINAKLIRNNQVVWQNIGMINDYDPQMPRYEMEEIRKDPTKLYAMWNKAAEKAVTNMINDMGIGK